MVEKLTGKNSHWGESKDEFVFGCAFFSSKIIFVIVRDLGFVIY
jgi:hypothetical protein